MSEPYYYSEDVAKLQVLLEEVTRAKPGSPEARFIQPEGGIVDRLGAKFHHALFGRRGTGKSSLLRHIENNLKTNGHLVAWADQETFMGLSYPDVLVSTLAETFRQFAAQLDAREPVASKRWYQRRPNLTPTQELVVDLQRVAAQLIDLKKSPDQSDIEWTATFSDESSYDNGLTLEGAGSVRAFSGKALWRRNRGTKKSRGGGMAQKYVSDKSQHLERAVTTYRDLMSRVTQLKGDAFVILDDFYRLPEDVQPQIAGYFHRVVKDTGVWLKFGSISFWTRLYAGGSPAVGLQAPHDLRELSLDRGLLDFKSSKRFLEEILGALAAECDVRINELFSAGALDRLVLAAGGVPRDYIGLVSESVAVAKNRGPSAKAGTERIIAEDVNSAAGRTADVKIRDMEEDTGDAAANLRSLVIDITNHCRSVNSACFLVNSQNDELVRNLHRLQNMRFVHSIASNETIPNHQSDRYNVYVLDVSQLAAQRAWQVDFMGWTKREGRRARKLVFPSESGLNISDPEQPDQALDDDLAVVGEIDPSRN